MAKSSIRPVDCGTPKTLGAPNPNLKVIPLFKKQHQKKDFPNQKTIGGTHASPNDALTLEKLDPTLARAKSAAPGEQGEGSHRLRAHKGSKLEKKKTKKKGEMKRER